MTSLATPASQHDDSARRPIVGFVLSGGGSLGAVQAGMVLALADEGIYPDVLAGASVGALNAAFLAGRPGRAGVDALAEIWLRLKRRDVMPLRPGQIITGLSARRPTLLHSDRLALFIRTRLPYQRLEDAPLPLAVTATDAHTGQPVQLAKGDAVTALLASTAIPGVFPSVVVDGKTLVDGSIVDDQPIDAAVGLGADVVYVLPSPYPDPRELPTDPYSMALRATQHAIVRRNEVELALAPPGVRVHVVPTITTGISTFDFTHAGALIDESRALAARWLADLPVSARHP